MFISEQHNFVFIHVPKTAGLSIGGVLMGHCGDLKSRIDDLVPDNLEDFHHPLAAEIQQQMGAARWAQYFSFSFVRNPWERLLSWYCMAQQTRTITPLLEHIRQRSFADFIAFDPPLRQTRHNQSDWLSDAAGTPIVQFIGRFEHLERDFTTVSRIIGVPATLRHLNGTRHTAYQDYYTPATRQIVAKRFACDIEMFAYRF
jgi:hypothetical protein